jgi:RimJ/RimL family protein N-acetyltransferase
MRGRHIAPVLRFVLYDHLAQMGIKRIFSITEAFNTPAMRFKEKLCARIIRSFVFVSLFGVFKKNFELKLSK